MLQLIYILVFTVIAFLTVANLIRNLIQFSTESPRMRSASARTSSSTSQGVPHPELLDDKGQVIHEPLLVMRSISVEDAREKLDALYNSSPSVSSDRNDEEETR
jgi:Protein of unknown function (DUF2973)